MIITIDPRFRGPAHSGNGGYCSGLTAAALGRPLGPAAVTLRTPPPLETPLTVTREGDLVRVSDRETPVTLASPHAPLTGKIPNVSWDEANRATSGFPWRTNHPYPQCFVCGTDREPGDGLRIFPGPVPGRPLAAAPWLPDRSVVTGDQVVRPEIAWAALDCPSLFGWACFHRWESPLLLGRFTAEIHRLPRRDEPCICVGWFLERDGRKHHTAAALTTAAGELLGTSRATWIVLRPEHPVTAEANEAAGR